MKVRVKRATVSVTGEKPWYAPYVGKFFWVNPNSLTDGRYNLQFRNSHLTILKRDVRVIPRFIRKLFHAWNGELPVSVQA